jgi:dGTPase
MSLASYACDPMLTRGRRIAEPSAPTRTAFQRDRDRVVHSNAFRRLVYKTQVFLNHEGDLFRTRLTHSLEVAQLGRAVARSLGLCEDLVEAIALAHDLGHTPFGHAGQDALNECMSGHGGFEHNLQSLRVVDALEKRYPAWDGLNLCFETREGILKRCSLATALSLESVEPKGVGSRFIKGQQPSLEAQLCNLADEIAYNTHDIDDGVRSGLLDVAALGQVQIFRRHASLVTTEFPTLLDCEPKRFLAEILRRMLSSQVYDLIDTTRSRLQAFKPTCVEDVRALQVLVGFSDEMKSEIAELKRFLFEHLYRHPQVTATTKIGRQIIYDLFAVYRAAPSELPPEFQYEGDPVRGVADYVAGMTDRFASREHQRHYGEDLFGMN